MAGTKKRKEPAQSSTLHDFFTSSSMKKVKGYTTAPKLSERNIATPAVASEDIIVISDDDAPQDKSQLCDMNVSPDCASIELKIEDLSSGTFAIQVEDQEAVQEQTDEWSDTDNPTYEEGKLQSMVDLIQSSDHPGDSEQSRCGEWEMGDDEDIYLPEEEEENEAITEIEAKLSPAPVKLCESSYPSVPNACPVCGKTLDGYFQTEVDRHVNFCIDALSVPSPPLDVQVREHGPLTAVQPSPCIPSTTTPAKSTSAFSVLMSNYKENDAWKEASEAESMKGNIRGRRPAPFYKVIQGMPIAVDAFRYGKIPGVTAYFLTHAHSDHYTNLSSSWKNDPKWVHALPMDQPTVIPNTGDVEVTLIQANHCPGSVLFLFKGMQTVHAGDSNFRSPFVGSQRIFRFLHCGDFRACPHHVLHSEVKGERIDTVYLDTTYLDPKYCFPPQPLVISACAELAHRIVNKNRNGVPDESTPEEKPRKSQGLMSGWLNISAKGKEKERSTENDERVLVVVGAYTIGKERIVKAIARALSTKIYCDPRKTAVLRCLSDPELHAMLTTDPFAAGVHLVPLHVISAETFKDYLAKWKGHWSKAVGFRPTGWTYTPPAGTDTLPSIPHVIARDQTRTFTHAHLRQMRNSTPTLMLYGVPYSEHSSFFELTCFALSLDWGNMIATVNVGSQKTRIKMTKWFEKWREERNKRYKMSEKVVQYRQLDYW